MSAISKIYYSLCRSRGGHGAARVVLAAARKLGLANEFRMPLDALSLDHAAAEGLMRLWSRIHWSSGDGMMPPKQLFEVYRLAATWPGKGNIVELGAWVGLTTSYLATACRARGDGVVWAVDTFAGTREHGTTYPSIERFGGSTLDAFRDQIERAGIGDRVEVMIEDTVEAAQRYDGGPVRMLLIDADHSYDGVRGDFTSWLPHVSPGGLIVFHDYDMPEVASFIDREVRRDARVEMSPGNSVTNVMAVRKKPATDGVRFEESPRDTVPRGEMVTA